jgi:hypothetical protein
MPKSVVRLQLDGDGVVWSGTDHDIAVKSNMEPGLFLSQELPKISGLSEIQLFGSIRNAQLIELLYFLRQRGGLPDEMSIRLGSPAACPKDIEPKRALQELWKRDIIEGPGFRWVDLSQREFTSYALIAAMVRNNWRPNDSCRAIIPYHPAWPAISFIPSIDVNAACMLLCVITDPRWFVQDFRPNRVNKLYQYLGVTPRNLKFIDGQDVSPERHYERCSIVIRSWASRVDGVKIDSADSFLQRICRGGEAWSRGMLLACKAFIRFVREVWLSELSPHRKMFDPDMFFKANAESKAYRRHYSRVRKRTAGDTCT